MLIITKLINSFKLLGIDLPESIVVDGRYREIIIDGKTWWYITDKLYPFIARFGCREENLSKICSTVKYNSLRAEHKSNYMSALSKMDDFLDRVAAGEIEFYTNGDTKVAKDDEEDDDIWHNLQPILSPHFNPGELLTDINRIICKYIDIEPHAAYAVTLWIAFTWFVNMFHISPLLIIIADDERHDNMSSLFSILLKLSKKAVRANSISTSIFLRTLHFDNPTLLYDDPTTIKNRNTLNLMYGSYKRPEAYMFNSDIDEESGFSTFGAKALASYDNLPKSIKYRGIVIDLNQSEYFIRADRLSQADPEMLETLKRDLEYFASNYHAQVSAARPEMPNYLNNSAQDNWEPLFKIAMVAGEDWLDKAVQASIWLSEIEDKDKVICEQLLSDVYDIVNCIDTDRIPTETLISGLCANVEKPWATYDRGENITSTQLASLLKKFGLKSKQMRIDGLKQPNKRGYSKRQIEKAYESYIAATTK